MLTPIQQNEHVRLELDHGEWEEGLEIMLNPFTSHGQLRVLFRNSVRSKKTGLRCIFGKSPDLDLAEQSVGCAHPAAEAWPDHCRSRYY